MKFLLTTITFLSISIVHAEDKIKMYFNNEDITKIIEMYSKFSGQKFVVDSTVRGKVSIFVQEPVAAEEAFNHLSSALALNGFGVSKQGDTMIVKNARSIQRDLIEVYTDKPALKPERMVTWIYTFKNLNPQTVQQQLRLLTSSYGEVAVNTDTNQIIITDWASNINHASAVLKEVDIKVDPATAKLVASSKKENELRHQERAKKSDDKTESAEKTSH